MRARILLGGSLMLALSACGEDQEPEYARAFRERIRDADYRGWTRPAGYEVRRRSDAPHGDAIDLYVNDIAEAALATRGLERWPTGSILVKDGFDDGDLEFTAAMEKREDGWFWVEYDGDGDTLYSGSPALCRGCHVGGSDYVRAVFLPL